MIKRLSIWLYNWLTEKNFFISGVGKKPNGDLCFFHLRFTSYGNYFPLQDIIAGAGRKHNLTDVVVISVNRLPNKLAKNINKKNIKFPTP